MYPIGEKPQHVNTISRLLMYDTTTHLNANLSPPYEDDVTGKFGLAAVPASLMFNFRQSAIFYNIKPFWAVPKPKIISSMEKIYLIFEKIVWVLILLSFLIIVVTWWIILNYNSRSQQFSLILLNVWETTLLGSMNKVPLQWPLRFLFIGYVVYCIHIQAVVISKITDLLTSIQYERGIQNLDDLSESNLSILISNISKLIYFHDEQIDEEHRYTYKNIHRLLYATKDNQIVENFMKCVVKYKCAAFFVGDENYLNSSISEVSHVFEDASATGTMNYVFISMKHSYAFLTVSTVINRLIESGISNHYTKKIIEIAKLLKVEKESKVLTVGDAHIVFIFLEVVSVIIYSDDETSFEIVLKIFKQENLLNVNVNANSKWLVITTNGNFSQVFLKFWEYDVLNLLVLVYNHNSLRLYTSDPQTIANSCGTTCDLVNEQNCDSQITHQFPKTLRKYTNCTFTLVSIYPIAKEPQHVNSISRLLMYETARHLNASLDFSVGKEKIRKFMIGVLPVIHTFNLEPSVTFYSKKPLWAVPKPKTVSSIEKFCLIFEKMVWVLILLSFLLIVVTWWIILRCNSRNQELQLILLNVWETTLLGYMHRVPLQWSLRFLFIGYVVYCIHIQAVVISKIVDLLTTIQYEKGIQNLNDLSESNISILIVDTTKSTYMGRIPIDQEDRYIYKNIHHLLYEIEQNQIVETLMKCVVKYKCAAFFVGDEDYVNRSLSEVSHIFEDASATVFLILGACLTLEVCGHHHSASEPIVTTPKGKIKGTIIKSLLERDIFSFRGIRYGKAPIGELRFQPPVAVDNWNDVYNASDNGAACPQPGDILKSEDCLFLNVYTTRLPSNSRNPKRPVIVYIHPGGFYGLSGASYVEGPQYLLDRDIVLVTINYRLGVLGFASTGDKLAPGNNGLKDQVLALKWVQENILSFGGDPNLVTIVGYSAGGVSVAGHLISPMSRGLFHRAIAMSDTIFAQWPFEHHQFHVMQKQAQLVGCPNDTSENIMNCLKTKSAEELGDSLFGFYEFRYDPVLIWMPVIELDFGQERFLTEHPITSALKGNFAKVPFMTGVTTEEFSYYAPGNSTIEGLKHLYADGTVGFGVNRGVKLISKLNTECTYYYRFSYKGRYSHVYLPNSTIPYGVVHHDDLIYLFRVQDLFPKFTTSDPEYKMVRKLTTIITNFARTGKPIPSPVEGLDNVDWIPFTPENNKYMDIGDTLQMRESLYEDRYSVWDKLFPLSDYEN
ncbi:hypothetical protein FQR65_LT03869 [Abscondita terminalis]|nr:hypothetical protein FQR65_LT03869 [Abscondita terminalis]